MPNVPPIGPSFILSLQVNQFLHLFKYVLYLKNEYSYGRESNWSRMIGGNGKCTQGHICYAEFPYAALASGLHKAVEALKRGICRFVFRNWKEILLGWGGGGREADALDS